MTSMSLKPTSFTTAVRSLDQSRPQDEAHKSATTVFHEKHDRMAQPAAALQH
jgi:hypothetical protein